MQCSHADRAARPTHTKLGRTIIQEHHSKLVFFKIIFKAFSSVLDFVNCCTLKFWHKLNSPRSIQDGLKVCHVSCRLEKLTLTIFDILGYHPELWHLPVQQHFDSGTADNTSGEHNKLSEAACWKWQRSSLGAPAAYRLLASDGPSLSAFSSSSGTQPAYPGWSCWFGLENL